MLRLLNPVLQRTEEPTLRRQLEEATLKQRAIEEQVDRLLAEVQRLCAMELFDAAIGLIRAESAGVRQAKRVQATLKSCSALVQAESAKLDAIGSAYAALDGPDCTVAFQRIARVETGSPTPAGATEIEQRLGGRVRLIADQQVMQSIEASRQALGADDPSLADRLLQNADNWQAYSTPGVQSDWKAVQADIAAAKKVLRFRKVLGR